jgi:hypothetical protein
MAPTPPDSASLVSQQSSVTGLTRQGTSQTTRAPHIFSLDTFSSKDFIVKDLVEALSDSAAPARRSLGTPGLPANAQSAQAFDPKPLIRTFEHALTRLKTLSEDLEERENELSAGVRRAENNHNQNTQSQEKKLQRTIDNFHQLERTLDGDSDIGGNAAVRIGERLEELDKQRQRAQDAKFVLQCWIEVSERGDLSSLDDVRRMGAGEGKVRCAHIARQLLKISQRLDPDLDSGTTGQPKSNGVRFDETNGGEDSESSSRTPNGRKAREIIEKFLEMLEKDLLRSFDDFYRRQNFDGMLECAVALRDFGEGSSVISLFVNQHQFFIDRSQLVTEELTTDNETWDRLADPDMEPPGIEPGLQALIDEVKVVVQEESFIIKRAFPYYDEVLARFLQRVFQQSIQQRLEMVLNKTDSISSLAFLRSLQASRSYISALVDDLKAHGLTEHPEPVNSVTAAVLDQQLDELFVPYFTGSSYLEREKHNLSELFEGLLFKFTLYHSRRRKLNVQSSTYLGALSARSKELISNAREAYSERLDAGELPTSQKNMMMRIAGLRDDNQHSSPTGNKEPEITDEDGQLSLPNTKRMLKWLAEAVGRGLELSTSGNDTPKEVRELLHLLIANMGEIYLETALDAANEKAYAAEQTTKTEPDTSYIIDLRTAISILHLMLTTVKMLLLPLASTNLTIRRDLEKRTSAFTDRMESKTDAVLQRTIDASLAWTARLLTGQKKTDYRPRDDANLQLDQLQTPTCQSIFAFLYRLQSRAASSLSGKVLESFSLELAVGLRSLLLNHFKTFSVSQTGALAVSKDIAKYCELLRGWDLPASFKPSLDVLEEISNVFVIGPEALRDRMRNVGGAGGLLPGVERADLRGFVLKREDAASVGVQAVLNGL